MSIKPRSRDWIAWLCNTTDNRDDKPIRIKAKTASEARELAQLELRGRFLLRDVYTISDFHRRYPGWRGLV